jgi:hypothetical protein
MQQSRIWESKTKMIYSLCPDILHAVGGVKGLGLMLEVKGWFCKTAQPDIFELRCKGSDKIVFLLGNNAQFVSLSPTLP